MREKAETEEAQALLDGQRVTWMNWNKSKIGDIWAFHHSSRAGTGDNPIVQAKTNTGLSWFPNSCCGRVLYHTPDRKVDLFRDILQGEASGAPGVDMAFLTGFWMGIVYKNLANAPELNAFFEAETFKTIYDCDRYTIWIRLGRNAEYPRTKTIPPVPKVPRVRAIRAIPPVHQVEVGVYDEHVNQPRIWRPRAGGSGVRDVRGRFVKVGREGPAGRVLQGGVRGRGEVRPPREVRVVRPPGRIRNAGHRE